MAIGIDRVYQKVLAIANKEQRGYITPQEFNLYADQAQKDIFEQYFYDINQFEKRKGNDTEYSDMLDVIDQKLTQFKTVVTLAPPTSGVGLQIPDGLYRLSYISFNNNIIQKVSMKELQHINSSLIIKQSLTNPVYTYFNDQIRYYPDEISAVTNSFTCAYIKSPSQPNWAYVFIDDMPFFDDNNAVDFELHKSEENNLVNKILQLAGITMNNEIYQVASQEEIKDIQQEKA